MAVPPRSGHMKNKGQPCGGGPVGEGRAESSLDGPKGGLFRQVRSTSYDASTKDGDGNTTSAGETTRVL
jgi:hypothetical protein